MCGICAVIQGDGDFNAGRVCQQVIFRLLHRGQEGGTIFYDNDGVLRPKEWDGISLQGAEESPDFDSKIAIAHNRYGTYGASRRENNQPFQAGPWFYAHNGTLGREEDIERSRAFAQKVGAEFSATSDSQILGELFRHAPYETLEDKMRAALHSVSGSASFVAADMQSGERAVAARKRGNRPFFMVEYEGGLVFTSEDHMFNRKYDREPVPPGTILKYDHGTVTTHDVWEGYFDERHSLFEIIYFSHPNTTFRGKYIEEYRRELGKGLAKSDDVDADIVAPVPVSGVPSALGYYAGRYGEERDIPYDNAFFRNTYSGFARSFIESTEQQRIEAIQSKLDVSYYSADRNDSLILIDDSIVRGKTMTTLVGALRKEGFDEVHVRIPAPPIVGADHYGIDLDEDGVIADADRSMQGIERYVADEVGADTVRYLRLGQVMETLNAVASESLEKEDIDAACFKNGTYWGLGVEPDRYW